MHGLTVRLPLPVGPGVGAALDAVDPVKVIDGLHPVYLGRLSAGRPEMLSCTPKEVRTVL